MSNMDRTTSVSQDIESHVLNVCDTDEKPWTCPDCDAIFIKSLDLTAHAYSHCDYTAKTLKCSSDIEVHKTTDTLLFSCHVCSKDFETAPEQEEHILFTHTDETPIKCLSNDETGTSDNMSVHAYNHSYDADNPFKCSYCEECFQISNALQAHEKTHTDIKRLECHICNERFVTQTDVDSHLLTHTADVVYTCFVCGKGFANAFEMKLHMWVHGEQDRAFKCNICDNGFRKPYHLQEHMKTHGGKAFECHLCNKRFSAIPSLKAHLLVHTGDKPYSCNVCKKDFRTSRQCIVHMNIHNKKTFSCDFCGKSYKTETGYKKHVILQQGLCDLKVSVGVSSTL